VSAVFVIAANTFRQTVRQRLFYNVAVFGVGMILLSMVIGNLTYGYPDRVVRSIGLAGVAIATDLVALLVGVSLIHEEIDRKTLFVVLVRPVRRSSYVWGRYLGLVATLALVLAGLSAVFFLTLLSVRGEVRSGDLVALSAALPEAAILGGIGLMLSAFSTPTLSAGIGIGIWIVGAVTDDFIRLTEKSDDPVRAIAKAAYYIFPSLARFNFREMAIYRTSLTFNEYAGAFGYGIVYCVVLGALASIILTRREMV
jgi:ABC-type transport system involved in multi-copper enzyme maturation permease subunit